jgi:arginine decarboxylase
MDKKALLEILEWKIKEMAKIRELEINGIWYRTEVLRVPMDSYGCVVSALVYLP